jgi:hypothetical protein
MTTAAMTALNDLAQKMPSDALRAAVRDCLAWQSDGAPPANGPLIDMATDMNDETIGTLNRIEMAGAAVLTEVAKRFARVTPTLPSGTVSRMYDADGHPAAQVVGVEAEVSYDHMTRRAQAFCVAGKLIGELMDAHVESIHAGGIRLVGVEAMTPTSGLRKQVWHYVPHGT